MSWRDKLNSAINQIVDQAADTADAATNLKSWIEGLIDALAAGDNAKAGRLFSKLDAALPQAKIGELILAAAVRRNEEATLEVALRFIINRSLLTNRKLINATLSLIELETHRIRVISILAIRVLNLDNLVSAIAQCTDSAAALGLLLKASYPGGRSLQWQLLLKYASKPGLESLFGLLLDALHGHTSWNLGRIVTLALGLEGTYRQRCLSRLFPLLRDRGWWDLPAIVRYLFENNSSLLDPFIRALWKVNVLDWTDLRPLLDAPASLYAADTGRMERLFTQIFAILAEFARETQALGLLATRLVEWMTTSAPIDSLGRNDPLSVHLRGLGLFDVPRPVRLAGVALSAYGSNALAAPQQTMPVSQAVVNALRAAGAAGEQVLIMLTRMPAVFVFLFPALLMLAAAIPMSFVTWFGQDVRRIQQPDRKLKIKELPKPEKGKVKYMIFSDLHRDASTDIVHPQLFDVSHFRRNRDIYLRALRYCDAQGYTVVENGDCEELWSRPRIHEVVEDRAANILATHSDVYAVLNDLHQRQRYFRTRGNHDNYWMLVPGLIGQLRNIFGSGFEIYDALVIPEVKTMDDGLLPSGDPSGIPTGTEAALDYLLGHAPLGLSPARYDERKPFFVLHGHQVDFWNCDEHHFLGLILANAVGMPADGFDALPYYLKGIETAGNPWKKFWEPLAYKNPWDNWPPEDVARRLARQIEFMPEESRHLLDSVSYSETLAASLSLMLGYNSVGAVKLCDLPGPQVQICTGHTHNPQSRPYLNLGIPPFSLVPEPGKTMLGWIKAPYFNSGTGSWWEGIIWAIEITDEGQPRLVYWDRQSCEPQIMSWELHGTKIDVPAEIRQLAQQTDMLGGQAGTRFEAEIQRLLARLPQIAAIGGNHQVDFSLFDDAAQYAHLAYTTLQTIKQVLCGERMPAFRLDLTFNPNRIPKLEFKPGSLSTLAETPAAPLGNTLKAWCGYVGISLRNNTWMELDASNQRLLSGCFFTTAYFYRSGFCHSLGHILQICASSGLSVSVRTTGNSAKFEIRLHKT